MMLALTLLQGLFAPRPGAASPVGAAADVPAFTLEDARAATVTAPPAEKEAAPDPALPDAAEDDGTVPQSGGIEPSGLPIPVGPKAPAAVQADPTGAARPAPGRPDASLAAHPTRVRSASGPDRQDSPPPHPAVMREEEATAPSATPEAEVGPDHPADPVMVPATAPIAPPVAAKRAAASGAPSAPPEGAVAPDAHKRAAPPVPTSVPVVMASVVSQPLRHPKSDALPEIAAGPSPDAQADAAQPGPTPALEVDSPDTPNAELPRRAEAAVHAMLDRTGPQSDTSTPEDLGRVQVTLHRDGDDWRVVVSADNPETLDLMRRHADQLQQDLAQQGLAGAHLDFSDWSEAEADAPLPDRAGHEADAPPPVARYAHQPHLPASGLDLRL